MINVEHSIITNRPPGLGRPFSLSASPAPVKRGPQEVS
jgi:hypothetical protein